MQYITRLDVEKFKRLFSNVVAEEVIITDVQMGHIRDRHPEVLEDFQKYAKEVIDDPDYILENRPNTGLLLKSVEKAGKRYQLALRLKIPTDPEEYKNSVITFTRIREKEWERLLRNKKVLYKKA